MTCDITGPERAGLLADFGAGRLRALVSAQVLNEGIDLPDASIAVVVAGRLGGREYIQRVGRVLRPGRGPGGEPSTKRALVYELIARGTFEERQLRLRTEVLR